MNLLLGDEDEQVKEAALSFIDEFERSNESDGNETLLATAHESVPSTRSKSRARKASREAKARKRAEINERKRMLRKAGIYGDPNKARNAQTREIAFLREELKKLTLDLQILQCRRSEASRVIVPVNASAPLIPSMWQKLAERQRLRREEAETRNLRLRLLWSAIRSWQSISATWLGSEHASWPTSTSR